MSQKHRTFTGSKPNRRTPIRQQREKSNTGNFSVDPGNLLMDKSFIQHSDSLEKDTQSFTIKPLTPAQSERRKPNNEILPVNTSSYSTSSRIMQHLESNPWEDDTQSFGALHHALRLGQAMNLTQELSEETKEDILQEMRQSSSSLQLLQLTNEIDSVAAEIKQTSRDIIKYQTDKETKDICRCSIMEQRTKCLDGWNTHLQEILENKADLMTRLQKPKIKDYIPIEATYKRYASEIIPMLVPLLAELSTSLDNLEWFTKNSDFRQQVEPVLDEVTNLLAGLESRFQAIWKMKSAFATEYHLEKTLTKSPPLH